VVLYAIQRGVRRVVACSARAARLGVRVGMPLAEVAAVSKSPGSPGRALHESLTILPHDPAADRRALLELAAACGRFSPLVGVEDSPAPECLLLDISRVAMLFGGERALARRVAWVRPGREPAGWLIRCIGNRTANRTGGAGNQELVNELFPQSKHQSRATRVGAKRNPGKQYLHQF